MKNEIELVQNKMMFDGIKKFMQSVLSTYEVFIYL